MEGSQLSLETEEGCRGEIEGKFVESACGNSQEL